MTPQERKLWYDFLKGLDLTIYRQKVIGSYIVDFCIQSKHLIIEIDGTQHYEEENKTKDEIRDRTLSKLGYRVLRYTNKEINQNFKSVCEDILNHI